MHEEPAKVLWLQNNNNNNTPGQQNQQRPGARPNGQPSPRGGASLNRWLLIIVLAMLGIYAYSFFTQNNSSNTGQVDQITYSSFYNFIDARDIKQL
jgi:cell division protease FtsH